MLINKTKVNISKYVYRLFLPIFLFFVFSSNASAQVHSAIGGGGSCQTGSFCNPLGSVSTFSGLVSAILNIVVKFGIPISALAIIFSGFLFVVAQGNEEKLKTAKRALLYSVIGTGILLGAWALSSAIGTTIKSLQ